MHLTSLAPSSWSAFRQQAEVEAEIRAACDANRDVAAFRHLGESEQGRALYAVVMGTGARAVSLIAGAHSDEPVGPETLRTFILEGLRRREELSDLLTRYRFVIVPHVNPDGEAANQAWIQAWPSLEHYIRHAFREPPGRDLEFGFPSLRVENRLVAGLLHEHAPFALHVNLHGMGFSEGAMLLIERHWAFRTRVLQDRFTAAVRSAGLALHDHNRQGEKGFFYLAPGYNTTPEGEMMRIYFRAQGDEQTARLFRDNSMEFVRSLGGDPLCIVTELPLFVLPNDRPEPGHPAAYLAFRERLPELKLRLEHGRDIHDVLEVFRPGPLDLALAIRLQLSVIASGLDLQAGGNHLI